MSQNKDIDLVEIINKLWIKRKIILFSTIIFFFIGIVYSLTRNNIYEASSTFYPHLQKNAIPNSNLQSIAGLAGINLSNNESDIIPTSLYPNLLYSNPFKIKILNEIITFNSNLISYKDYLKLKSKKIELFNINKKEEINYSNSDFLLISNEDNDVLKIFEEKISININDKDGYIQLKVLDEEPLIAAKIARACEETLQESIIDFKLKNIKSVYNFTLKQLNESKKNYYALQDSLAKFKDANKNIKSDIFLNQLDRLEFEFKISESVYNELNLQKEKTAIEVQRNTPIFTVINPVTIPMEKTYPRRTQIVLIFILIGMLIGSSYVYYIDKK